MVKKKESGVRVEVAEHLLWDEAKETTVV